MRYACIGSRQSAPGSFQRNTIHLLSALQRTFVGARPYSSGPRMMFAMEKSKLAGMRAGLVVVSWASRDAGRSRATQSRLRGMITELCVIPQRAG